MEDLNRSNFCIRPFNSVLVATDGSICSCCIIEKQKNFNIKTNSIKEFWDSEYLKELRTKFLKNERPKECQLCWDSEYENLNSHRLQSNTQYKTIFKKNYEKNLELIKKDRLSYPEDIELAVSNICNLACQMCRGQDSSKLLIENNDLNFEKLNQNDYNLGNTNYLQLEEIINQDFKLINLRGGEPLYNKNVIRIIEKLASTGKAKDIKLHITTNATICNEKILSLLSQFKDIRIMFSIDSVENYNNYIRYPSNWEKIKKNIIKFKTLKKKYLYINTVVQNLNILYLEPLIDFAYNNNIFLNFTKLVTPNYLELNNLPIHLLKNSYERLIKIEKKKLIHTENINEIISFLKKSIENYSLDKSKFQNFVNMIKKRDQYRKISIKDYMPEIYNII